MNSRFRPSRSVLVLLAALCPLLAAHAQAQEIQAPGAAQPPVPPNATLLRLDAVGHAAVSPDLLVATLGVEQTAHDPATAQATVNKRVADAMHDAAAVPGVSARLQDYSVQPGGPKNQDWTAHQTLVLQGKDDRSLLDLVGRLQGHGLMLNDLSWTLSPAAREAADARASDAALRALRTRADAAARSLGLKVSGLREVQLSGEGGPVRPRPMMRMMAGAVPPQATQDDQDVTQDASAVVTLLPP
jgi:uncharacterized protein